jgi:Na+-translocating ferredoxin:NAD+ oxidoreductase RnfG subunit
MRIVLLIAMFMGAATVARAERYMTVAEAQKLCFPQATRFTERVVRFSDSDVAKIKAKAGVPVKNEGNRVVFAYAGEALVGTMMIDHVLGKHEIIDYAVAISPEGKVLQVEILEYRESYGYEIRSPKWRKQFAGKGAASALKLNRDIYNISGATMSCRHVSDGIKRVLATYELLCQPLLARSGGVSHASAAP